MKKYLDIFIWALLIVLTINLFTGTNEKLETQLSGKISIETTEKAYTIPPVVALKVINNST